MDLVFLSSTPHMVNLFHMMHTSIFLIQRGSVCSTVCGEYVFFLSEEIGSGTYIVYPRLNHKTSNGEYVVIIILINKSTLC